MTAPLSFEDWLALNQLYADYASAVDSGNWNLWPEFFTDDCVYKLQPRENFDRGFPLATLAFTDCQVPATALLGELNGGFKLAMRTGWSIGCVRVTLMNMVRAGDAALTTPVRRPGVKRPVPLYARAVCMADAHDADDGAPPFNRAARIDQRIATRRGHLHGQALLV